MVAKAKKAAKPKKVLLVCTGDELDTQVEATQPTSKIHLEKVETQRYDSFSGQYHTISMKRASVEGGAHYMELCVSGFREASGISLELGESVLVSFGKKRAAPKMKKAEA